MADIIYPGNASPNQVLSGNTFSAGTNYNQSGNMPNNGAVTITPGPNAQSIPAGYHNGSGTVPGVTVPAANVLTGTTIAGTPGTMPENGSLGTITPGTNPISIPPGHTTGGTVAGDANLVASNIASGTSIFGVNGTLPVINGVINSYTVATGSANINAGDFVDYVNSGQVKKHVMYDSPVTSQIASGNLNSSVMILAADKISSTQAIVVINLSSAIQAFVVTFNGSTVTCGTTVQLESASGTGYSIKVKMLDATRGFILYGYSSTPYILGFSISGTTITAMNGSGSNAQLYSASASYSLALTINGNTIVALYAPSSGSPYVYAKAGTINGSGTSTTITWGAQTTIYTNSSYVYINEVKCLDPQNNIFIFGTVNAANLVLITFQITGTTPTITVLQTEPYSDGGQNINGGTFAIKVINPNLVVIIYFDTTSYSIRYRSVIIQSSTMSFGTETVIYTGQITQDINKSISITDLISNFGTNYFVIQFSNFSNGYLYMIILSYDSNGNLTVNSLITTSTVCGNDNWLMSLSTDCLLSVYLGSTQSEFIMNVTESKFGIAKTAGTPGNTISVAI